MATKTRSIKKARESTFEELIKWLDEFGWEKGMALLEKHLQKTEWAQAHLFGEGDPKSIRQALLFQRLLKTDKK